MSEREYFHRPDRGVVTIAGTERASFLQGLISNDIDLAGTGDAIWSALLTPQGKFRHDFFLLDDPNQTDAPSYMIDCEGGERLMDFGITLRRYVLRAAVKLDIARDLAVFQAHGDGAAAALLLPDRPGAAVPFAGGVAFIDPRDPLGGVRIMAPAEAAQAALERAGFKPGDRAAWDAVRIPRGLPDGSRDLIVDKAVLLENGFDELGGVDWKKGCYMGQELTARTKYRGLVKKRLMPVRLSGHTTGGPQSGALITLGGKEAGELRSTADGWGMALLRLKAVQSAAATGKPLEADGATVTPAPPEWLILGDSETA
jgi:folate-binding protein YgfZ